MLIATLENWENIPLKVKALFMDTTFPKSRVVDYNDPTNFISELEKMVVKVPDDYLESIRFLADHRKDGTVIKIDVDGRIRYCDTMRTWFVRVDDVDTTRPWTMDTHKEYDEDEEIVISTREFISYLDYDIKEKSLNYAIRKDGRRWL